MNRSLKALLFLVHVWLFNRSSHSVSLLQQHKPASEGAGSPRSHFYQIKRNYSHACTLTSHSEVLDCMSHVNMFAYQILEFADNLIYWHLRNAITVFIYKLHFHVCQVVNNVWNMRRDI